MICHLEMELDLPGGVIQAQEEIEAEVVGVGVEWGVTALEPALVAVVSALTVVQVTPSSRNSLLQFELP